MSHFQFLFNFCMKIVHEWMAVNIWNNINQTPYTVHSTSKQMSHARSSTLKFIYFRMRRKIKLFAIDLYYWMPRHTSHLLKCVAVFKICAIVQNTQRQVRRKICFSKLLTRADKMKNVFLSIHQTLGVLSSPIHFGKPSTICMIGSYQFISGAVFFSLFPSPSFSCLLFYCFFSFVFYRWMHSGEHISPRWHELMVSQIKSERKKSANTAFMHLNIRWWSSTFNESNDFARRKKSTSNVHTISYRIIWML